MYFRFGAAIVLVVVVSVIGVALETQSLSYRRAISRQRYRMDVLVEQYAQMRLQAQRLGAPARTIKSLEEKRGDMNKPARSAQAGPSSPLAIPRATLVLPHLKDISPR
ncbi:MAG: hypothetical protein FJ302_07185 [Planctomycetes bacterium]|nr:hypothetical protein [Planctomycetota bacterium]